jgi:hypothetical protein
MTAKTTTPKPTKPRKPRASRKKPAQYTDEQRDAATVAMLRDPEAYADGLIDDAARASMMPEDLPYYDTAEYVQALAVVEQVAQTLTDRYASPKMTAASYVDALRADGIPERVALDLWTKNLTNQLHEHRKVRRVDLYTGEVRTDKVYTRRWNKRDDLVGTITVGEVTFMLADDHDRTNSDGEYLVHLIAVPHHETMFYDLPDGNRVPYLGQYVPDSKRAEPGAGEQRAFLSNVRLLAVLSPTTAEQIGKRWHEAKQAARRLVEIAQAAAEADAPSDEQHRDEQPTERKRSALDLAHAAAMAIDPE